MKREVIQLRVMITLLCTSVGMGSAISQADTIRLRKPSFEQKPVQGLSYNSIIKGWFDCGILYFPNESPPDIHPINFWGNTKQAQDGDTYLGMVVRDNDTYESVSQKLPSKLIGGECYSFSLYLSRSERYISKSHQTKQDANYITPAVLRIWGGFGYCDVRELLGETVPIKHSDWQRYDFKFTPNQDMSSITLEAFYKVPVVLPYNGHILIDNLSDIVKIDCEPPVEIADVEEPKKVPPHKRKKPKPKPKPQPKEEKVVAAAAPNRILKDLDRNTIKKGQTIEIQNLYFLADTSSINEGSYDVLDEIYGFLKANDDVNIEIGGHTNGVPPHDYCDRLSTDRAREVARYLIRKGIESDRLRFKGYGKRKPIANNLTAEGRRKNQRVEIKILSIGKT